MSIYQKEPYILPHGTQMWWKDNTLHREDGPAVVDRNGEIQWYWHGVRYSFEDYVIKAKWTDEQIVMYKLEYD